MSKVERFPKEIADHQDLDLGNPLRLPWLCLKRTIPRSQNRSCLQEAEHISETISSLQIQNKHSGPPLCLKHKEDHP